MIDDRLDTRRVYVCPVAEAIVLSAQKDLFRDLSLAAIEDALLEKLEDEGEL